MLAVALPFLPETLPGCNKRPSREGWAAQWEWAGWLVWAPGEAWARSGTGRMLEGGAFKVRRAPPAPPAGGTGRQAKAPAAPGPAAAAWRQAAAAVGQAGARGHSMGAGAVECMFFFEQGWGRHANRAGGARPLGNLMQTQWRAGQGTDTRHTTGVMLHTWGEGRAGARRPRAAPPAPSAGAAREQCARGPEHGPTASDEAERGWARLSSRRSDNDRRSLELNWGITT
jgi:hypothetical protein